MRIYLDSCIPIYFYDHTGTFQVRAANRLAALAAAGDQIAVSDLVRLECWVLPLHTRDAAKLAIFDAFFARSDVQIVPITTAVFDRATAIRAAHGFKLGDSLHLAAATESRCDCFLTNDRAFRRSPPSPWKCCREHRAGCTVPPCLRIRLGNLVILTAIIPTCTHLCLPASSGIS
jgi:predicted nucleic acid-binding protein